MNAITPSAHPFVRWIHLAAHCFDSANRLVVGIIAKVIGIVFYVVFAAFQIVVAIITLAITLVRAIFSGVRRGICGGFEEITEMPEQVFFER